MRSNTLKRISTFKNKGLIEFKELIDKNKCDRLYKNILNNRRWGKNIFKTKKSFLKNPQYKKTNPGKGKFNLAERFDLNFIENHRDIKFITNSLSEKYALLEVGFANGVNQFSTGLNTAATYSFTASLIKAADCFRI